MVKGINGFAFLLILVVVKIIADCTVGIVEHYPLISSEGSEWGFLYAICEVLFFLMLVFRYWDTNLLAPALMRNDLNDNDLRTARVQGAILVALQLIFFLVFLGWYLSENESFGEFSPAALTESAVFAERYRNGFYKGSGFFTMPLALNAYLIVFHHFAFSRKIYKGWVIALIIVSLLVESFFLGLRVILLPIVMAYFVTSRIRLRGFILIAAAFPLLSIWKIMLAEPDGSGSSGLVALLNPVLRHKLWSFYTDQKWLLFDLLADKDDVKDIIFSGNSHIIHAYPPIELVSGVALPIFPLMNYFAGPLGFILAALFVWGAIQLVRWLAAGRDLFCIFAFVLVTALIGCIIEDYGFLSTIPVQIAFFSVIYIPTLGAARIYIKLHRSVAANAG